MSSGGGAPFAARMAAATESFGPLVFGLDPSGQILRDWGLGDTPDGLERFVDIAVEAAVGRVGLVKPQSAFYERHGWRGVRSLARLVDECRRAGVLVILDVKRGDVGSTNAAYAEAYLGAGAPIAVDAITVTAYLGLGAMGPFFFRAVEGGAGLFVVTRSSNPEGRGIQTARQASGRAVEEQLVLDLGAANRRVLSAGGGVSGAEGGGLGAAGASVGVGPFGAVFAPTHEPPSGIDLKAMAGLFLAPGVGAQGATPADVAACFAACPDRVLPSASRSLLVAGPDPGRLKAAVGTFALDVRAALDR